MSSPPLPPCRRPWSLSSRRLSCIALSLVTIPAPWPAAIVESAENENIPKAERTEIAASITRPRPSAASQIRTSPRSRQINYDAPIVRSPSVDIHGDNGAGRRSNLCLDQVRIDAEADRLDVHELTCAPVSRTAMAVAMNVRSGTRTSIPVRCRPPATTERSQPYRLLPRPHIWFPPVRRSAAQSHG